MRVSMASFFSHRPSSAQCWSFLLRLWLESFLWLKHLFVLSYRYVSVILSWIYWTSHLLPLLNSVMYETTYMNFCKFRLILWYKFIHIKFRTQQLTLHPSKERGRWNSEKLAKLVVSLIRSVIREPANYISVLMLFLPKMTKLLADPSSTDSHWTADM